MGLNINDNCKILCKLYNDNLFYGYHKAEIKKFLANWRTKTWNDERIGSEGCFAKSSMIHSFFRRNCANLEGINNLGELNGN